MRVRVTILVFLACAASAGVPGVAHAAPEELFAATGSLASTDPSLPTRLSTGAVTSCAAPTAATSTISAGPYFYDTYQLFNQLPVAACMVYTVNASACGGAFLQSSAYTPAFEPPSVVTNYLASSNSNFNGSQATTFAVPAGQPFTIKVNATSSGETCAQYQLNITSDPPQPAGPPNTGITSGPDGETTATDASFAFFANRPIVSFECSLDGAAFAACTSPASFSGLSAALHTFRVRAVDPNPNRGGDDTPAEARWRVTAPALPPPPGSDLVRPRSFFQALATAAELRRGRLIVFVAADEAARHRIAATLRGRGLRPVAFRPRSLRSDDGEIARTVLALPRRARAAVRRAVARRTRLIARVTVTSTDAAGNRATKVQRFRLRL